MSYYQVKTDIYKKNLYHEKKCSLRRNACKCCRHSFKDINKSYEEGVEPEDGGRWIYVFDLKGNPVRKYILDHAVYGIDVHEKEGIIYATDVNSDQPILKYTL